MDHRDVVAALCALYPGAEWSYDGDGSTLDPVYDGDELVAYGLEWHDASKPPTLEQLAAYEPALPLERVQADRLDATLAAIDPKALVTGEQLAQVVALLRGDVQPDGGIASLP